MTSRPATLEVYDFRQPRQLLPASWRTLRSWYGDGCELACKRWKKLGLAATLRYHQTRVLSLHDALDAIPEPGWGVQGTLGATSIPTLLACSPGHLRSLVRALLGDTSGDMAETELLTAVEESMGELLLVEFLQAMGDSWPGPEPLDFHLTDTVGQPQRTRMYPPRTILVVTTMGIHLTPQQPGETSETAGNDQQAEVDAQAPAGYDGLLAGNLVWLTPQQEIEDLIEIECTNSARPPAKPHPDIPRIMREMPVSVVVELGRTCLSMSELTSLQSGDVVVLEQSVSRPLNALVGDTSKFRGRPGQIGNRRCLEIQQVLEDTSGTPTA